MEKNAIEARNAEFDKEERKKLAGPLPSKGCPRRNDEWEKMIDKWK